MKMKKLFKISAFLLFAATLFVACEKNEDNVFSEYDLVDQENNALIKVNYNVAFYNNPGVQLKINGTRVSGLLNTRYPFPGGGFNTLGGSTGDYFAVKPGSTEILLSIPKRGTLLDSIEVFKSTVSLAASKRYSLHVADTLNRKSLLVEENVTLPDSGFFRMRFVNLMANVPSIDLYNGSTLVAARIPFMGISDAFTLSNATPTVNTWTIRVGGSAATSTAIATYSSASTILQRRVYTAFANGYSGYPTGGTDPRKPYISFYYIR